MSTKAAATATLSVLVPEGGQVWFDNTLTPQDGNKWVYTSKELTPGKSYTVSVKARWEGGSIEIPLRIQAGDNMSVDLTRK